MVKLQEAEDQIVIDYEVYDRRPSDSDLLIAAIEMHAPPMPARRGTAFVRLHRGRSGPSAGGYRGRRAGSNPGRV
jgi:hypothetical protein